MYLISLSTLVFNFLKLSRRGHLFGLLIILLGMGLTSSITQPAFAQSTLPAQDVPSETIIKKLLGQWQTQDPKSKTKITFVFAPSNKLYMVLPAPDNSLVALEIAYQINAKTQPMQLDLQLNSEQKALTIFEFTKDGQLQVIMEGVAPGTPRPTQFKGNATLFVKTSDSTTLAANIKIIKPEVAKQKTPQDEVKTYMTALTQVQQAHYREQGKFAATIEEVSIGLKTETDSYRYKFVPQANNTQSVMIIAEAKTAQLPSYTGAVFASQANGKVTTVAQICETEKPSTTPPAMPNEPTRGSSEVKCPTGSRSLIAR